MNYTYLILSTLFLILYGISMVLFITQKPKDDPRIKVLQTELATAKSTIKKLEKSVETADWRLDIIDYQLKELKEKPKPITRAVQKRLPELKEGEKHLEPHIQDLIDAEREVIRLDALKTEQDRKNNT